MAAHRSTIANRGWGSRIGLPLAIVGALLGVAVIAGGGGVPSPRPEIVVQLAALAALIVWFLHPATRDRAAPRDRIAVVAAAGLVLIPLLQLVPLPPGIWQSLGGRATAAAALDATGEPNRWMPISLAPARTLASALSLIVPLAVFYMSRRLTVTERTALLPVVAMLGFLAALVGALQVISGGQNLHFYPTHEGFAVGFQANRNSSADVLLIGLAALATSAWLWRDHFSTAWARAVPAIVGITMIIALLLTGSRTGIALLFAIAVIGIALFDRLRPAVRLGLGGSVVAMAAAAVLVAGHVPMLDRTMQRFALSDGARMELWQDTLFAIGQSGPLGSGMGTVVPMLIASERLEVVDPTLPNRAHNDYLEVALEGGVPAAVLVIVVLAVAGWRVRRLRHAPSADVRACATFAGATLFVIAAHSLVDYPLRSLSLAALCAFALGLLTDAPERRHGHR